MLTLNWSEESKTNTEYLRMYVLNGTKTLRQETSAAIRAADSAMVLKIRIALSVWKIYHFWLTVNAIATVPAMHPST